MSFACTYPILDIGDTLDLVYLRLPRNKVWTSYSEDWRVWRS